MVVECYFNGSVKNIYFLWFEVDIKEWIEIVKFLWKMFLEFRRLCEEESYNCVVYEIKVYLMSFKGMYVLVYDVF